MKRLMVGLAIWSTLVPFGVDASDFELVEQCFVGLHESRGKLASLESELARAKADLIQMQTDYPYLSEALEAGPADTSAGAEELDEAR